MQTSLHTASAANGAARPTAASHNAVARFSGNNCCTAHTPSSETAHVQEFQHKSFSVRGHAVPHAITVPGHGMGADGVFLNWHTGTCMFDFQIDL